jgi:hypothetical protein
MFYDEVSDIFQELENLSLEKNLIENLKLIAYSCDSSRQEDFGRYFRNVIDRIWQLSKSKDLHYTFYIILNVMFFLKEVKNYNAHLFKNEETLKILSLFFDLVEKMLLKAKNENEEYIEKNREIIEIIENNFNEEYYFRKNERLIPKQFNLPF